MTDDRVIVKCLVWDLDNTLWRGTLAEGDDVVVPEEVRRVVAELDARGVLQSVASKNDHDLAWARLEQVGLAEYFVLPHIGWGPKSASVRAIAERLNFAESTIAFVDDQPTERAEVAFHLPEVRCYPAERAADLVGLAEFSPPVVTEDSARRRRMYQAGFRRDAEREGFTGPDEDFLRTLDLRMTVVRATERELARAAELTLRTSQMNATGVPYDDDALRGLMSDPEHEVLVVGMSDRFGPHGAVGIVLLRRGSDVWHLKLLATSCRVVAFGAGSTLLNWIVDRAARAGVHLAADFRPTDRNRMMDIAYRFAGFDDEACGCLLPLGPVAVDGVQRLHLLPEPRPVSPVVTLDAVDLEVAHG
ncbi:HAD-IIIC family phosphatase [Umezawaea endophytica]|uniref:HAD-IIIC family phosphatase n=1 Tax=Umezawaea endophytica TaxID=1654476 RepID=A0A9X2VXH4_9PSEU|nr:HAD-IIIC family phosphatase [Umezawaea endophytica]MCS7483518.1 HAD-IIIC family phosphatase [Umezawaea endophytica]